MCRWCGGQVGSNAATFRMGCCAGTRRVLQVFVPKLQRLGSESVVLEQLDEANGFWVPEGVCVFPTYTRVMRGKVGRQWQTWISWM